MKGLIAEAVTRWLKLLLNEPHIPTELEKAEGPLLLHISDTPQEIYPYIVEVVKLLQPAYIIHTGDLLDNIKLEIRPQRSKEYRHGLTKWLPILENSSEAAIYYVIGNHDRLDIVNSITKRGIPITGDYIMIEGKKIYAAHCYQDKRGDYDYYLFGHSLEPVSAQNGKQIFLNGLNSINVIDLGTGRIYNLPYPLGTNTFRSMRKRKMGL